jgi:hypothetical protein
MKHKQKTNGFVFLLLPNVASTPKKGETGKKLANGTFKKISADLEKEALLLPGTLNYQTINPEF